MKEPDKDITIFNPANLVTLSRIGVLILLALTIRINVYWIRVLGVSLVPLLFYVDSYDEIETRIVAGRLVCQLPELYNPEGCHFYHWYLNLGIQARSFFHSRHTF